MRIFSCANGKTYQVPDKCCLNCQHCTDIFYDALGPYLVCCDVHSTPPVCEKYLDDTQEK